jgi:hypothetical protein
MPAAGTRYIAAAGALVLLSAISILLFYTARQKRKLRKEFSQLGRDSVRYNVQIGGYGVAQRRELPLEWLREQEDEDDKIKRWTLDAAVMTAVISVITLLVALGVIK